MHFKNQPIKKTHDLEVLLKYCGDLDGDFLSLREQAAFLSPFATYFRYPDDRLFPEPEEVEKSLKHATSILRFVEDKIKEEDDPQLRIF